MLMSKGKLDMLKGLVLASGGDDPPLSPAAALELIAQAAQAAELAEENARLAESEAAMREAIERMRQNMPLYHRQFHAEAHAALSSPSPLANAHKAAMRLAEHVTRPAWHTLIQVDGRAMALKEEYLSAQAACAPKGAEGTPNEH